MTLLITNARLIDPEAGSIAPGAVLIRNGVITEVFDTPTPDLSTDTGWVSRRQDDRLQPVTM